MADAMVLDAPAVVDQPAAGESGKPQGEQPSLSKLYDQLPEAARKAIKTDRYAKLPKLDNLVAEIDRLDGEVGKGIRVPGKDATKEQIAAYRKEMQIPDSPEAYTLTKPTLPNGLPYNENLEKWFRAEMHAAGMSNAAAQKFFDDWNKLQGDTFTQLMTARKQQSEQQVAAAVKTTMDGLAAEYKDEAPRMLQLRDAAWARFGGPGILAKLQQYRLPNGLTLDNDLEFSKMWIEVGKRMDEDKMVAGETGAGKTNIPRPGLPVSPNGYPLDFYPSMEKDPRYRVKAE